MARYAVTRVRNLRGLGTTFSFVPRRGLRGLGQTTDIDMVTGLPCDDPRANCGPLEPTTTIPAPTQIGPPPSFFTFPSPIIPPSKPVPLPPAPVITPSFAPTIVFPSGGTVAPTTMPAASWLDQQMITGVPNKYLAIGTIAAVVLLGMGKRRR
jgi:hypothetical protein